MDNNIPSYKKIKENLLEQIKTGKWSAGSKILTERELARKFSVSRMTARQAVRELEQEGLLVRKQGAGTFVAQEKIPHELTKLTSFSETLRLKGLEPGAITLKSSVEPAGLKLASILKIEPDDLVIKIDQIRLANGSPVSIFKLRVINSLCPGLTAEEIIFDDFFNIAEKRYGIVFEFAEHSFEAVAANREEADLLQVKTGFPLLQVERIAYGENRKPVTCSLMVFRSDKYSYKTILHRK